MEDQTQSVQDTQPAVETQPQETTSENLDSLASDDGLREQVASLNEKNSRLYARAKKYEEETKILRERLSSFDKKESPKGDSSSSPSWDDYDSLSLSTKGYSEPEISFAKTYAKGLGKRMSEVIGDEIFKTALEGIRSKASVEQATPPPSARAKPVETKTDQGSRVDFSTWQAQRNRKGKTAE